MPSASAVSSPVVRPRSRRRGRIVLAESVRLDVADGRTFDIRPSIVHSMQAEWFGFGDAEHLLYAPIHHRFDVVVKRDILDTCHESDEEADERWSALRLAYQAPAAPRVYDPEDPVRENEDELWLAYLNVGELPTHIVEQNGGWAETCDALGDTLHDVHEVLKRTRRRYTSSALIDGALLWALRLGVHPRARGQQIGLQLLAHGLWALQRSISDLAVLEAGAVKSHFDTETPQQTPASFQALCAYYARLGFRRCYPRRAVHTRGGSVMMLNLGERGIRADLASGGQLIP